MDTNIEIRYVQPRQDDQQIATTTFHVWAESGGHQIHLEISEAPKPALAAILAVAEEAVRAYFDNAPMIAHTALPVLHRSCGARPIEVSRASLWVLRKKLHDALGLPG